ncbi:MAG: sulfurtransferase [Zoogloeaceae bacterium]|uniref:sulfurtransferase n=1 Tax=Denitromonas sp. TaxID=2734609 RepID=UPI001E0AA12D|nr:sulfurtransferase [Rhodocyclaceae bacterium]MCP5221226.1 sulfurtransferase [Zoogloeaceae bacterium]
MSEPLRTLITPERLIHQLQAPNWVVVDCRHDLGNPDFGRAAYAKGHIPGAHFLHMDDELSGPRTGNNGRHPLPDPAVLARRLGEIGINRDSQVVAYDDGGGMYAARLWWLLNWLGHRQVAVLDGGFQAWCSASALLSQKDATPTPTRFDAELQPLAVDVDYVNTHKGSDAMLLIDARSPDRFRGENETIDPVGGHIPGAINRFFKDNLGPDGRFKPAEQLRREFTPLMADRGPEHVVHQCGSGVTACHNILAMEIAGLPGGRLYPGSWSEWCADAGRAVARGA